MRLVFGTDFSRPARDAATLAARLAARRQAALTLVHVVDPVRPGPPMGEESIMEHASACLEAEAARLAELGADVDQVLLVGAPDEGLVEVATRQTADLVILAAQGGRAGKTTPLGKIAERTAQTSSVAILVVRDAAPLHTWMDGTRALRVVVGTDFTASSDAALTWAASLAPFGPVEMVAGHAYIPSLEHRRLGIHGTTDAYDRIPEVEALLARDLAGKLGHHPDLPSCRVVVKGAYARTAHTLVDIAEAEHADLLVVGAHQRHGLSRAWYGSVSHGVLHMAPMAVACVPPVAPAAGGVAVRETSRILVPTDFSPEASRAIGQAYGLLPRGGTVILLHVAPEPPGDARKQEILARLRRMPPARTDVVTEVDVDHAADVTEAICQAAERHAVDLICLGSHGRSGLLRRTLLGSVADGVLRRSSRAVLVVKPEPA